MIADQSADRSLIVVEVNFIIVIKRTVESTPIIYLADFNSFNSFIMSADKRSFVCFILEIVEFLAAVRHWVNWSIKLLMSVVFLHWKERERSPSKSSNERLNDYQFF